MVKAYHSGVDVEIVQSCEGGSHLAHGPDTIVLMLDSPIGTRQGPMQYVRGDGVVVSSTLDRILCSNFTGMGSAYQTTEACLSGKQPPARLNVSTCYIVY